jgi:hypothetical protein
MNLFKTRQRSFRLNDCGIQKAGNHYFVIASGKRSNPERTSWITTTRNPSDDECRLCKYLDQKSSKTR